VKIKIRKTESVAIIDLSGKLMGGPDADVFKDTVKQLIQEGYKKVLVNLAHVPWVNSTGLGILIAGYTTLKREGGALKLTHVTDRIESILMITKLGTIFESFSDEEEALKSFENT
jgi:anti-sigma B factor antagonist